MFESGSMLAGRYRIDTYLERSELGDVYQATDLTAQVPVILKVLRPDLAGDWGFAERFRQIAPELAALEHPGIARFYAFEHFGSLAWTVSAYVPGVTLQRHLLDAGGPLLLSETSRIVDQVAAALVYAHRRGLVHGSLQPANIVLDDGQAVLEDFGIATVALGAVGDFAYLSPEQLQGRDVSAQTDVYSLGAVLYEMATGQRPFAGDRGTGATERERLADEHVTLVPADPHAANPDLTPGATGVILRALDKRPAARWPGPPALAQAWRQALGIEPARAAAPVIGAPLPGVSNMTTVSSGVPVGDAPPMHARRGLLWLLVGLALAVGILAAGLALWLVTGGFGGDRRQAAWAGGIFGPTPALTATQAHSGARQTPASASPSLTTLEPATAEAGARATTLVAVNLRAGPGTDTPVIGGFPADTRVSIVGRNAVGDWWQVCCSDGQRGWVFANLVAASGPLQGVPVTGPTAPAAGQLATSTVTPAAAPSSVPTAVATAPPVAVAPAGPPPAPGQPSPPSPPLAPSPAPVSACPRSPEGSFASLPVAGQFVLACPVGDLVQTHFSHQFFERGQMIYRYDVRSIYVLYADGTWASYLDTYVEGQPQQQQTFDPPAGLKQPIKGFDRVWERPEVRTRLGWATRDELGVIGGQAEDFQRGISTWLSYPGYPVNYFVLLSDGHWLQY